MNSKLFSKSLAIFENLLTFRNCRTYSTNCLFHKLNTNSNQLFVNYSEIIINKNNKCFELSTKRSFSRKSDSDNESEDEDLNKRKSYLMKFKPIVFHNFWYKWKNFLTINTIIRPFFDNEFNLDKFMFGSKQALVQISNRLADGDIDSIKDLVTEEAFTQIRHNFSLMNQNERNELRVGFEDILYSFPYRIGIIMNDNDEKRFVEITVVFYCLQTLKQSKDLTLSQFLEEFGQNLIICNYRFIRDYTKDVESDWSVNLLAHFHNNFRY